MTIENQSIELAEKLSPSFLSGVGDGLLGLAFGSINTVKPKPVATPVENMIAQRDIPKTSELFTAYLGSYKDEKDADRGASFYTFGYIDQTALGGQTPWYTPIDSSNGFWQFKSTTASVGSKKIARTGNTAIADTGTTLALVGDELCAAIYAAIPGARYDSSQQGYLFPSNTTLDKIPVVSFDVGGREFAVQKEDLAFASAGNGKAVSRTLLPSVLRDYGVETYVNGHLQRPNPLPFTATHLCSPLFDRFDEDTLTLKFARNDLRWYPVPRRLRFRYPG